MLYDLPGNAHTFFVTIQGTKYKSKLKVRVIRESDGRLWLSYPFSKQFNVEIKSSFRGYKWHGFDKVPRKQWSIEDCDHNWFQLRVLSGEDIYLRFDATNIHDLPRQDVAYAHQIDMANFWLSRHYAFWAAEMGTGKTLAAMMSLEYINKLDPLKTRDVWWVAPRSALDSVRYEFRHWGSQVSPIFVTYASLKKEIENSDYAPRVVVFDESSRFKNEKPVRSQAAYFLADQVRKYHEWDGYVLAMTGSPAPKSPVDWWHQCEVVAPGFLKEANQFKAKERLAIEETVESDGMSFPRLKAWRDNSNRCDICGDFREGHDDFDHLFRPSIDEVSLLHTRMQGLVKTVFKKDCLDLPEKVYQEIKLRPTKETISLVQLLKGSTSGGAELLTKLRALSDGFQYVEKVVGKEDCPTCSATGIYKRPIYESDPRDFGTGPQGIENSGFEEMECPTCAGAKEINTVEQGVEEYDTPKIQALKDQLDLHAEDGRLVVFAGFTGSIDLITRIVSSQKWDWIRYDGRGVVTSWGDTENWLDIFQNRGAKKICFIGQPGAAGMGLTLTASQTIVYYSNTFNGEDRIQSEDRIHRPSSRGANIVDFIHLPSDKYVLDNIKEKRRLQSITLGEVLENV